MKPIQLLGGSSAGSESFRDSFERGRRAAEAEGTEADAFVHTAKFFSKMVQDKYFEALEVDEDDHLKIKALHADVREIVERLYELRDAFWAWVRDGHQGSPVTEHPEEEIDAALHLAVVYDEEKMLPLLVRSEDRQARQARRLEKSRKSRKSRGPRDDRFDVYGKPR